MSTFTTTDGTKLVLLSIVLVLVSGFEHLGEGQLPWLMLVAIGLALYGTFMASNAEE